MVKREYKKLTGEKQENYTKVAIQCKIAKTS